MNSFKQFQDLISNININSAYLIGTIVVIGTFVIECILIHKGYLNTKTSNKNYVEKAVNLNHQIKAQRISYYDDYKDVSEMNNSWYHAKYEYTINNKKRKYRYLSKSFPPSTLTLYYINNPKKVFCYEEKTSVFAILFYIIPFIIGIVIINLLK